ncbi:MAG: CoA transferase [Dehalococcoidia bacterium]
MQPLAGLNVLDLTWHVAGPYATSLLADYGADVLKVERPGVGDPARRYGPFPGDVPHPERSGTFLHLNTNKRSITLDLQTAPGRALIMALARDADVVVESFAPRVLSSLGLDYDALSRINPRLVMCSLSNFGQTGPYRDWKATDFTLHAIGGQTVSTGVSEQEPLKAADHLMEYQAGSMVALAVMGAVLHQRWQGVGQYIDVAVYEVIQTSADRRMTALLGYEYNGQPAVRSPMLPTALPLGYFPCKDGYVCMVVAPPARWTRFMALIGREDLIDDSRFQSPDVWARPEIKEEIDGMFYPWLLERTKQQVMEEAQAARIATTAISTPLDVLNDPHFQARGFFRRADHPEAGVLPYAGPSFSIDGGGWELRSTAPLLGQHNQEVYMGRLGLAPHEMSRLRAEGVV